MKKYSPEEVVQELKKDYAKWRERQLKSLVQSPLDVTVLTDPKGVKKDPLGSKK